MPFLWISLWNKRVYREGTVQNGAISVHKLLVISGETGDNEGIMPFYLCKNQLLPVDKKRLTRRKMPSSCG